jgi:Protein of unknown function (DUF1552)
MKRSEPNRGTLSRRTVLRGAGVALTLPWLESLAPRSAGAQSAAPPLRFLPIFLPNGAPELWKPEASGSGDAWRLSSILAPLVAQKARLTVISGLENGSVFNPDGSDQVEPAHGRQAGAWLTCADAVAVRERLRVPDANGISVDQVVAAAASVGGKTALPSLQLGLSTTNSICDAQPCSLSRSVSWKSETEPLGKLVDPKEVFARLVGASAGDPSGVEALKRRTLKKSVLDAVDRSTNAIRTKLSMQDAQHLEQFLYAVREVEKRVDLIPAVGNCGVQQAPVFADLGPGVEYRQNTATYNKGGHADWMAEMIALAFQCDITRVISYMLEDERSEFVYDNVKRRTFSATGFVESGGVCGEYAGAQRGDTDSYASITWWNVAVVANLCDRLSRVYDAGGKPVLDNTLIYFGSCMHGTEQRCSDLPALLIGNGGGALKTDQHVALDKRPLRDLYATLLNGAFALGVTDFGVNRTGAPLAVIDELLA